MRLKAYWYYIIGAATLVVAITVWLLFFSAKPQKGIWSLVPSNAAMVIEVANPVTTWLRIKEGDVFKSVSKLEVFKDLDHDFMAAKLALKPLTDLTEFSKEKTVFISQHPEGDGSYQYLVYLPIQPDSFHSLEQKISKSLIEKGWKIRKRTFQQTDLYELEHTASATRFAYAYTDETFLVSRKALLIEDAIRAKEKTTQWETTISASNWESDKERVRFYLNANSLAVYQNKYFPSISTGFTKDHWKLTGFNGQWVSGENNLQLTGGIQVADSSTLVSYGKEIDEAVFKVLPQQAAVMQLSAVLPELWLNQKANANQQIAENVLRQQYRANVEELKASVQGTLGLVIPEPEIFGETNPDKLVYFPYNQTLAKVCLTMANQETSETEGTANDIIGLSSPAITEAIAGESYRLEGNAYVMKQEDYLIFSNSYARLSALKEALVNKESLEGYQMPDKNLRYLAVVRGAYAKNMLTGFGDEAVKQAIAKSDTVYSKFKSASFGIGEAQEGGYKALLAFELNTEKQQNAIAITEEETIISLNGLPVLAPKLGRNTSTSKLDLVYADSAKHLVLKVVNQDSSFKYQTEGTINISPVAFNAVNGARWVSASTSKGIELVAEGDTNTAMLIPHNRFRAATWLKSFELMPDSEPLLLTYLPDTGLMQINWRSKELRRWPNLPLKGNFLYPPISFKQGNTTYLAIANDAGNIYLINQLGKLVPGFPVNAETRILTQLFTKSGNSATDSYILAMSEYGGLSRWNIDGTFLEKNQFERPGKDCRFVLVPEAQSHGFVIARFAAGRLDFFKPNGTKMGEGIPATGELPELQYYQFGGGKEVLLLNYQKTGRTYIYNGALKKLTEKPISNRYPVSLLFNSRTLKYTIYTTTEKGIVKVNLQ
jgi:hypothetical protein